MADVFISYARQERDRAEQIKSKLDELKLDLFFDIESIDGGAAFPVVLTKALDGSRAVLACCSPYYFTRPWCMSEAHEGATRGILVPVILERFERTAPPLNLRGLNFLDLSDWSGGDDHEDWNRALLTLGKLVGRDLVPPTKDRPLVNRQTHRASQRERDLALLGLQVGSSSSEIKTAYRKLFFELHPDANRNWEKPEVADRFKAIGEAYERLRRL